jgi:hypothetical protein
VLPRARLLDEAVKTTVLAGTVDLDAPAGLVEEGGDATPDPAGGAEGRPIVSPSVRGKAAVVEKSVSALEEHLAVVARRHVDRADIAGHPIGTQFGAMVAPCGVAREIEV